MGRPFGAAADQTAEMAPSAVVSRSPLGGFGGPYGTTCSVAADGSLLPTALSAVKVKLYAVPLVRPGTVTEVASDSAWTLPPPGLVVTVKPVSGLPPSGGMDHLTLAERSPGAAAATGASGTAAAAVPVGASLLGVATEVSAI